MSHWQGGKRKSTGFEHLCRAWGWSWAGLRAAVRQEAAFRQELVLVAILTPLALWFGESGVERALLLGSLFLILIVELLNTAVEAVVDRIGTDHHPLAGQAKDLGSAAVFLSLINGAVVWLCLLWP